MSEDERGKAPPPPSPRQEAILSWARRRDRVHATVNAVAGSGKTTTLKQVCAALLEQHPGANLAFFAFNNHIANELKAKLPSGVTVQTVHSAGLAVIRERRKFVKIDGDKYKNLVRDLLQRVVEAPPGVLPPALENLRCSRPKPTDPAALSEWGQKVFRVQKATIALCDLSRAFLVLADDQDALEALADDHNLTDDLGGDEVDCAVELVKKARQQGMDLFESRGILDFTDMVFLPAAMPSRFPIRGKYDFILADEIQDFSPMMTRLLRRIVGFFGRFLGVGDPSQAIYGFAGADPQSFHKTTAAFYATTFPLDVCYRCPVKHIQEAQEFVPEIKPREGASEGVLETRDYSWVLENTPPGALVLSRTNAPLVSMTYAFLVKGVRAQMMGRDIGKSLVVTVQEIRKGFSQGRGKKRGAAPNADNFGAAIERWGEAQRSKLEKKKSQSESKVISLTDRVDCLTLLWEHFPEQDLDKFEDYISGFFSDVDSQPGTGITLSSIHRAKGLEAPHVVFLNPGKGCKATQPWEREQEKNLQYIAFTRSTEVLILTNAPKRSEVVVTSEVVVAEDPIVDPEMDNLVHPAQE